MLSHIWQNQMRRIRRTTKRAKPNKTGASAQERAYTLGHSQNLGTLLRVADANSHHFFSQRTTVTWKDAATIDSKVAPHKEEKPSGESTQEPRQHVWPSSADTRTSREHTQIFCNKQRWCANPRKKNKHTHTHTHT